MSLPLQSLGSRWSNQKSCGSVVDLLVKTGHLIKLDGEGKQVRSTSTSTAPCWLTYPIVVPIWEGALCVHNEMEEGNVEVGLDGASDNSEPGSVYSIFWGQAVCVPACHVLCVVDQVVVCSSQAL